MLVTLLLSTLNLQFPKLDTSLEDMYCMTIAKVNELVKFLYRVRPDQQVQLGDFPLLRSFRSKINRYI